MAFLLAVVLVVSVVALSPLGDLGHTLKVLLQLTSFKTVRTNCNQVYRVLL